MHFFQRAKLIVRIQGAFVLLSASLASCQKSDESAQTTSNGAPEEWVEVAPALANPLGAKRTLEPSAYALTASAESTQEAAQATPQNVDCESIWSLVDKLRCREQLAASKTQKKDLATTKTTAEDMPHEASTSPPKGVLGTLLKKRNVQSEALSSSEVCFIPSGRHTLARKPEVRSNAQANVTSLFVSLSKNLPECGFSEGYLAVAHVAGSSKPAEQTFETTARGQAYANAARSKSIGAFTGACYLYVWNAIKSVVGGHIENTSIGRPAGYMFRDWGRANPGELSSIFGLKEVDVSATRAPIGSVLIWSPGQCGYHRDYGHIEIVVSPGQACSDGCAPVRSCGSNPAVFAPL
ncbi:MAG: hypothetical protein IOD12_14210 [Silvanigrellales bacterium]|nr:hypothetical protein [Silvanigrellales bacterium]